MKCCHQRSSQLDREQGATGQSKTGIDHGHGVVDVDEVLSECAAYRNEKSTQ
jgi:hypothetical protein